LAEKGDETAVLREWNKEKDKFRGDRHALEVLAWGVLKKGSFLSNSMFMSMLLLELL